MDWTAIICGIIAALGVAVNALITNVIGNKLLNKANEDLQKMQHDHEEKMQQRQQEFEKSLLKRQEEKEEKDRAERERKNAIEKYHNGICAFLSNSWVDEAFALATSSYSTVLEYAPQQLRPKMTELHNLILKIHQTDMGYDENGTVNLREPLEKRAHFLFAEICHEWVELQSIPISPQNINSDTAKSEGDHNDPVEQCPLPEEKPLEFVF